MRSSCSKSDVSPSLRDGGILKRMRPAEQFFQSLKQASSEPEVATKEKLKVPETAPLEGSSPLWGEVEPDASEQHSEAAVAADALERGKLLDGLFAQKGPTDKAERKQMAQCFSAITKGNYSTSSMHFQPKQASIAPREPTRMEQIRRLCGRV